MVKAKKAKSGKKTVKKVQNAGPPRKNTTAMKNEMILVNLGPSSAAYAASLGNPKSGPLAAIPNYPAAYTKKVRTWAKGTFNCSSTTGFGGICACPENGIANNLISVYSSLLTGVQNNFDLATATDFVGTMTNSEYPAASFGVGTALSTYRVVSSVLRARYIDTELNRGGQKVGYMDVNHVSAMGQTLPLLDLQESSLRTPISREWFNVLYKPIDGPDLDFKGAFPASIPAAGDLTFYLMIAVQGPGLAPGATFEWEFYSTYEVKGQNIRGMTPSHLDVVGFNAVHAAATLGTNLYPTLKPLENLQIGMIRESSEYAAKQTTQVVKVNKKDVSASDWDKLNNTLHDVNNILDISSNLLSMFF